MKQKIFLILPILLLVITGILLGTNPEFPNILAAVHQVILPYLGLACALMGGYWLLNAGILRLLFRTEHDQLTWKHAIQLTMVGQYYSAITPFATGGQPAQILSMTAKKIPVGRATSLLMIKFLIYQICVVLYAFVFFAWEYRYVHATLSQSFPWILLGLILNGILILLIFLSLIKRSWMEQTLNRLLTWFGSKKKGFREQQWKNKIRQILDDYENSAKAVQNSPMLAGKVFLMTLLQLTAYFAVSWAIYRSFGFSHIGIQRVLALQALLYMAISFIPTPGNAGASEGGFLLIFQLLFTGGTLMPAMLLWRLITYYLNLLFGGLVTLYDHWDCSRLPKKAPSLG
jgi:hypothetical protein